MIDASNPEWRTQAEVVDRLTEQLVTESTPRIVAFNKCDIYTGEALPRGENTVRISARTGEGMDDLIEEIRAVLEKGRRRATLRLPYSEGSLLDSLYKEAEVLNVEYGEGYIEAEAVLTPELYGRLRQFIREGDS